MNGKWLAATKRVLFPTRVKSNYTLGQQIWRSRESYMLLLPYFILFTLFTVIPVAASLCLGFTYFNMLNVPSFVGLANYQALFLNDEIFLLAVKNTLIFSFLTVTLHANQNVTGLAMTTLGVGISDFLIASVDGYKFTAGAKFFNASLPFADDLGAFGKLFFSYGIMIYLSIAVAIATSLVLNRTKVGLHLRAVGENPATADAAGINVTKYRYVATCTGSAIAGLGGLMFVMDYLNGNWEYVIDAIGWLCVALVIFTTWKPVFGIFCSIVFGAFYVAAEYIPGISLASKEIFKMLPFLVTIIVLIMISVKNKKENQPPASLGQSYFREER